MLVVIAYYVLNVACEFLVTTLWISPFAGAWLPNVVFTIVTIFWFYRVSRAVTMTILFRYMLREYVKIFGMLAFPGS